MAPSGGGILRRLEPGWRVWDQAGGIWGGLGEGVWEVWEGGVGVAGRRASLCARPVRPGSADSEDSCLKAKQDSGTDEEIPLPNVKTAILSKVH